VAAVVTHSGGVLDDDVAVLVFRADGEALETLASRPPAFG
jgi:hypothetical protein